MNGWIQHRPDRPKPHKARYRDPDGKEHSKSFMKESDAQRWLRRKLGTIDDGTWVDPQTGTITWAEWSDLLQAGRLHLAARTRETDRICHNRSAPHLGHIPLNRIRPDDIRALMSLLIAAGYAAETVAKTTRWVRLTLNQAVRDRRIGSSPADGIRLPRPQRGNMRLLTPPEVELLANAMPDRYRSLVIVAAYSGLRFGELAALAVSDIDLLRRRLTVRNTLVEAAGEHPRLGPPKSKASERTITLPRRAVDALAEHLASFPPVSGFIWTTEEGGFLRRGSFSRIWRKAVQASVGPPCRLHDLRHGHASWLIAAGEHPKTIQSRLGHGSIQVTIDRYGWLMDGLDEKTADKLDQLAATYNPWPTAQNGPAGRIQGVAEEPPFGESPSTTGDITRQPRPGSNWRFRLERPAS